METFEEPLFKRVGFTLIEVLIALVIFSLAIGMSSRFIAEGLKSPFIMTPVEEWVEFINQTANRISTLPGNSPLRSPGPHSTPFPELKQPKNLKNWNLSWERNSLGGKNALFTANNKRGKTIRWRFYQPN